MANIMIKRGVLDNIVTYTHICDTLADLPNVPAQFTTMGSHAIVLKGVNNKYTEYMCDSAGKWVQIFINTSGGGGSINFGPENAGKIVIVGSTGDLTSSIITEDNIIAAIIDNEEIALEGVVGLHANYANSNFKRAYAAQNLTQGTDFNNYSMYGGRKRCNVSDDGTITAFYGDNQYRDDGSNGQVMIYQPKFYYMRTPKTLATITTGSVIREEVIAISDRPMPGFKLHPLFKDANGEELEYVLIGAYEGCAQKPNGTYNLTDSSAVAFATDKLSSISGTKPISGLNVALTVTNAEQLATNRGSGWHITNLAAESAMQLLELIEFGSFNTQLALEKGIVETTNDTRYNCASITGSTATLGNATGHASETIQDINGSQTVYNVAGKRAISYRGMENPWGNTWRMIGGVNLVGDSSSYTGGAVYLCTDFNYSGASGSNYTYLNFNFSARQDWISGFGYNSTIDWTFIPIEALNASSLLPIGDSVWSSGSFNSTHMLMIGGHWNHGDNAGGFFYAGDRAYTDYGRSYSARLMFIPTKNEIYDANYILWQSKMN